MHPRLKRLLDALTSNGLHGGLQHLNHPVDHRYTGVYRLKDSVFRNIALYDKEGEMLPEFLAEVPLEDSFCQFVIRDGLFKTEHSGNDHRLDGHKYQGVLLTYHGVPVLDNRGELYGTLCHFDALHTTIPDEEFEFLQSAARLIPRFLPL